MACEYSRLSSLLATRDPVDASRERRRNVSRGTRSEERLLNSLASSYSHITIQNLRYSNQHTPSVQFGGCGQYTYDICNIFLKVILRAYTVRSIVHLCCKKRKQKTNTQELQIYKVIIQPKGGWWDQQSFNGKTPLRVPTPFINHFSQKRYPLRIPSIDKWCPFHMPSLEHTIPFNCCKCTDFYEYITKPRSFLDFFTAIKCVW